MTEELKLSAHTQVVIADPHLAPVQYVDWIVCAGLGPAAGAINIDLAAIDHAFSAESGATPQAIVQSRLRMTVSTAENIVRVLHGLLEALKPPTSEAEVN